MSQPPCRMREGKEQRSGTREEETAKCIGRVRKEKAERRGTSRWRDVGEKGNELHKIVLHFAIKQS